jgi:hypothetical protein
VVLKAAVPPEAPPAAPAAEPEDAEAMKNALLGALEAPPQEAAPPQPRRVRRQALPSVEEEPAPGPTVLSDHAFQRAVGSWRGVKRCIQETESSLKEEVTGAVKLAFTIAASGQVVDCQVVHKSADTPKQLAECVVARARDEVSFPAFDEPQQVVKEAKFVF